MYYFYSRKSTANQNSARQIENFKQHPEFRPENLYVDSIQGNVPFIERPEASKLFDVVTANNDNQITIVVDSIDRLGRNLLDILNTIEKFNKNKINLKSLKEGFETIIDGKENPMAKMVISVMGSIGEMERNRIRERSMEGIKIARAQGKFKGRKLGSVQSDSKLLERHESIVKKLKKGLTVREISQILCCSTTTVVKVKKVLTKRTALV